MALPCEEGGEETNRSVPNGQRETPVTFKASLIWRAGSLLLALALVGIVLKAVSSGEGETNRILSTSLEQTGEDDFCDRFSDPEGCRAFRKKAKYKYWTEGKVKDELWKLMKGVAMMEEKMTASDVHHTQAVASQQRCVCVLKRLFVQMQHSASRAFGMHRPPHEESSGPVRLPMPCLATAAPGHVPVRPLAFK
jgi:hypothetical protein